MLRNKSHHTKDLLVLLFESLEQLRNGEITPQAAREIARLSNSAQGVVRLEMDYARFVSDVRSINNGQGDNQLQPLKLT
jgi:hypothetical protein